MKKLLLLVAALFGPVFMVNAGEAPLNISGATTIDSDKARQLFDQGATFIDVRTRKKWQWGRVEGSHHFGLRTTFSLLRYEGFVERDDPIVIYGNGPHSMRAALAVYMASTWGYTQIYYYREGYFSWLAQDHPAAMGRKISPVETAILGNLSECQAKC